MFRRPSTQQPLSLMTINATPNRKASSPSNYDNLLTIRILETSERKMQLLKKLLTPEEYNSIASDLFTGDEIRAGIASSRNTALTGQQSGRHFSHKSHMSSVPMHFDDIKQQGTFSRQHLSKSETNLRLPATTVSASTNLHENLTKKREALEFFFQEPPERVSRGADDLAIELRSGHYLSSITPEAEEKVINTSGQFNFLDRLEGFLGFFGISLHFFNNSDTELDAEATKNNESDAKTMTTASTAEDEFISYHKKLNCEPYTRKRNLLLAKRRLEADKQLNKIIKVIVSGRSKVETNRNKSDSSNERTNCSNLVDLAKMHKSHITISSKLSGQQFRVIQAVGHFNMIHLAGPKKFSEEMIPASPELLFSYNNLLYSSRTATTNNSRRRPRQDLQAANLCSMTTTTTTGFELSSKRTGQNLKITKQHFRLNLMSLKFKSHALMLAEERVSIKLIEARDRMRSVKAELNAASNRLIESVETFAGESGTVELPQGSSKFLLERISQSFEDRMRLIRNFKSAQEELLSISNELDSLRKEQGFNSTRTEVIVKTPAAKRETDLIKDALSKLAQSIAKRNIDQPNQPIGSNENDTLIYLNRLIDEEGRVWGEQQPFRDLQVREFGLNLTPSDKCPPEEAQRRRAVKSFFGSFMIRLLIGDLYKYDCTIEERPVSFCLDLSENILSIPLTLSAFSNGANSKNSAEVDLSVVVYTKGHRLVPFSQKLIGSGTIKLPIDFADRAHSIGVKFVDSNSVDEETEAQLEFMADFQLVRGSQFEWQFKFDKLVDSLYKRTLKAEHSFEDTRTKLFKLANRVDTSLLLALIARPARGNSWGSYFALDPFEVQLATPVEPQPSTIDQKQYQHDNDEDDDKTTKQQQPSHAGYQGSRSVRHALLAWRWINNLNNQPIHLSERENIKAFSLQEEEFRSKLESSMVATRASMLSTDDDDDGYKSIEQTRTLAVEFIKRYEFKLWELLKFNTELESAGNCRGANRAAARLADLLREPQLKFDFPNIFEVARRLAPRRTANRPLMRRRRAHKFSFGAQSAGHEFDTARAQDLESQVFGQWQRFTASQRINGAGLQLVVTVQQANNVPMRVVSQRHQQQPSILTRPNSPFLHHQQASSASPTNFISLIQHAAAAGSAPSTVQSNYVLVAPTTYVEIVFQRKQQASSLSQGKNPSWNETLLFPVDVSRSISMTSAPLGGDDSLQQYSAANQNQLFDEFLQLNLYDYNCYLQAEPGGGAGTSSMLQTMPMVLSEQANDFSNAAVGQPADSMIGVSRMLASRQRVERHLLGSLRVPLTTLISSGRIEGSFALSQPLFLDNYQFEPEPPLLSSVVAQRSSPLLDGQLNRRQTSQPETHMSLFITLDPPVSIPFQLYLPTGSYESQTVFEYTRFWEQVVSQHRSSAVRSGANIGSGAALSKRNPGKLGRLQPSRHIRALVLHQDAKYCLATRLLTPLKPPKGFHYTRSSGDPTDSQNQRPEEPSIPDQMRALARFVSLLSPLKYGLFSMHQLASGLWFDSAQLINKSLGGPEEKAILLCNYFLYLGKCSAILLGDAVPEGRCVYVIVWNEQSRFIEDQLQLQAIELLAASERACNPLDSNLESLSQMIRAPTPVEQHNFIPRLPILINSRSVQLWDPMSGKAYWLNDQLPLVSVGSIITMENVYANIQLIEQPSETNYDIRSKNFWFPLFEAKSLVGQASGTTGGSANTNANLSIMRAFDRKRANQMNWRAQLNCLELMRKSIGRPLTAPVLLEGSQEFQYKQFNEEQCRQLKEAIEQVVKAHLLKWRPNRPTYFNRTLSRLLDDKLALCESYQLNYSAARGQQESQRRDWRAELAELIRNEVLVAHLTSSSGLGTRQVISWPVNLPYTSMKTILDSLFASGVHNADLILADSYAGYGTKQSSTSSTQFLVSCHVHAYPARVASVWLYVAAILTSSRESQRF